MTGVFMAFQTHYDAFYDAGTLTEQGKALNGMVDAMCSGQERELYDICHRRYVINLRAGRVERDDAQVWAAARGAR